MCIWDQVRGRIQGKYDYNNNHLSCLKTIHNNLRSQQMHKEQDFDVLHEKFAGILSAVTKAVNCKVHTMLHATPTQLMFGRDAFLPVAFQADWEFIANSK